MFIKLLRILIGVIVVVMMITIASMIYVSPISAQQPCPEGTGPGGIYAGGEYAPQNLTQEQRQWLWEKFGHPGIAPVGYGGEPCGGAPTPTPKPPALGCNTPGTGPGGIRPGGYTPQNLSQEQRQWLWDIFGHPGFAPVGYGGENCKEVNGTYDQPPQQPPAEGNNPTYGAKYPEAQEHENGGILLPIYCAQTGHSGSSRNAQDAYDILYCNDGFRVNMKVACPEVWGSERPYASLADWTKKFGWRCVSTPGYIDPYPPEVGGGTNPPKQPQASGCGNALPANVSVGQKARVTYTDGSPNILRSGPSKSSGKMAEVPEGATFTIVGGPTCDSGYRYWQVSTSYGTGWMADSGDGKYWIEAIGGNAPLGSQYHGKVFVTLVDGSQYQFEVAYDNYTCIVTNGSDFVISQIQKLVAKMTGKNRGQQLETAFWYLAPKVGVPIGDAEKNRQRIEDELNKLSSVCQQNAQYQISIKHMDLSGVGNIAYGYFMEYLGFPLYWQDWAADKDQIIRDLWNLQKPSGQDNPDDIRQREVGRAVYLSGRLDVATLEEQVREHDLY